MFSALENFIDAEITLSSVFISKYINWKRKSVYRYLWGSIFLTLGYYLLTFSEQSFSFWVVFLVFGSIISLSFVVISLSAFWLWLVAYMAGKTKLKVGFDNNHLKLLYANGEIESYDNSLVSDFGVTKQHFFLVIKTGFLKNNFLLIKRDKLSEDFSNKLIEEIESVKKY